MPINCVNNTQIAVVVSARNESANIEICLKSILKQNYPKNLFEVWLIDDHSDDDTLEISRKIAASNLRILSLKDLGGTGKKRAITMAIERTKAQLVVTTDADCVVSANWLKTLAGFYEQNEVKFFTGPVVFEPCQSVLQKIWALDFIGMMGITGASVFKGWSNMSNGANLAYERAAFLAVDGFKGIDQIASGDDLLLMEKIARHFPNQVAFVKSREAIVKTLPPENMRHFLQQRIRWTSKSQFYQDWKITTILGLVWLFNVSIIVSFTLFLLGYPQLGMWICGQLFCKFLVDWIFLKSCMDFFKEKSKLLWLFLPTQFFQIPYIVWVGLVGNLGRKYEWKGRKVH